MYNQNRIYRLFKLINFLKSRPAKSIRSLESLLETSERTVYRYLDLLTELGFTIEKDGHNKLFITTANDSNPTQLPFTPQEVDFLKKLVLSVGKQNKLVDSILQKIQHSSEVEISSETIFKNNLSRMVEQISTAIKDGQQLLIKNYSSLNSQSISDRIVEPVCFTDNYTSLCAYEIKSKENKFFNIERMADVKVLDGTMKHRDKHEFNTPDIFGFQGKNLDKEIELEMSMRAALLLKEEYPMSSPLIKLIEKTKKYHFHAKVQSFKAPARFVQGFAEEIKVKGSIAFIQYLDGHKNKRH